LVTDVTDEEKDEMAEMYDALSDRGMGKYGLYENAIESLR